MDNALYVNLSRQSALMNELTTIATNIANMNTTGFRREASVFSEFIRAVDGPSGSLSMTAARSRYADTQQGVLTQTGGAFDFAVEGDGYFQVQTPAGMRLTRAGAFTPNTENQLTTLEGFPVLNNAGAPVFIPPDAHEHFRGARRVSLSGRPAASTSSAVMTVREPGRVATRSAGTLLDRRRARWSPAAKAAGEPKAFSRART